MNLSPTVSHRLNCVRILGRCSRKVRDAAIRLEGLDAPGPITVRSPCRTDFVQEVAAKDSEELLSLGLLCKGEFGMLIFVLVEESF
jgi:hypothetical protein